MLKPKIGILGLTMESYDKIYPGLREYKENFLKNFLGKNKDLADFVFTEVVNTREGVEKTISFYENQDCDALFIILLTYTPSLITLPSLKKTKLPIIILNTQEAYTVDNTSPIETLSRNQGVHGVQDICSVLKRSRVKYHVVTGYYDDEIFINKLKNICKIISTKRMLEKSRIGLLGYPFQGMGDFNIDETLMLSDLGPYIIHISVNELAEYIRQAPDNEVNSIVDNDKEAFLLSDAVSEEDLVNSAKVEWGLRKLIEKYGLNAWSQNFQVIAGDASIPVIPFFAASKLMSEGIMYSAEGDVCAAAAGLIVSGLAGQSTLSEMFTMDFKEDSVLMRHMGELNTGMGSKMSKIKIYSIKNNFTLNAATPLPVFGLNGGPATLVSLVPSENNKFRIITAQGNVVENSCIERFLSPNYKWKPLMPLNDFLDEYNNAGGSHHQSLGYGHLGEDLKLFCKLHDIQFTSIC